MKRMLFLVLVLASVLSVASLSFAAYEFYTKGIVIKILANKITVRDDKSKEITVEGNPEDIKLGDKVLIIREKPSDSSLKEKAELSSEDRDFLRQQCQVPQADIDIIPQLSQETQTKISAWIAAKDCRKLVPFKASRNYFRQLKPNEPLPFPPAGWNGNYLTEAEFKHYVEILNKAPW